ncbi:magnesium transporter [Solimonas terrae]|uniref:Magnesium transporter n=1 Tax=Solimonas terrae TaxID=1396819 RepID=A0A6M2BXG8_9GAMM|nr:magnesium transporter [Solimonas terrae]NGY06609.1 magnesium transporter [Solimonas terrae]
MDDQGLSELVRAVVSRVPLDAAELLKHETPERVAAVFERLPRNFARDVATHLPASLRPIDGVTADTAMPGTVADLMEPVTGLLPEHATVHDAIEFLRASRDAQQITYLYTVDRDERLSGLVVIRDLLLSRPDQALSEIMLPAPFSLSPDLDASEAIKAAVHRHYPVYPVVDAQGRMCGVIRGWRLFEQQAIEITAQSGQMVGVDKEERIDTTLWTAFRMRHPWLQVNLLTAFAAGFIVSLFEGTISQIVALAAFLPILAGQSGNTGCQALAITLRGITLGDLAKFPVRKLIGKELMLGAMNGCFTGVIAAAAMWWTAAHEHNPQAPMLALVIWLAMIGGCTLSGLFGVMVPLTLRRFGADPVTASSIFLTTGTDIAGMGLMLTLATVLVL